MGSRKAQALEAVSSAAFERFAYGSAVGRWSLLKIIRRRKVTRYLLAVLSVAAVTAALAPFHNQINSTTVALALLLMVLFAATFWGSRPALLASALAMLCFNFFFLPPVYTFTIADPQNWVALTAFLVTAVTAGQLSARARRRAEEAEAGRVEIKRLYEELRSAFERASHAEALRQSEQFKSALLDAVTHDLRTPLTSIKASATLLLEERDAAGEAESLDSEEQNTLLTVISEEADRLDRFIEGIVDLARIEAGEMRLHRNWRSVEEIIEAALTRARTLTREHEIEVVIEGELPVVRVDARAVAAVLYTLIDNATKYAPPRTRVRLAARHAPGEMIEMSVEDEGRGIPVALREHVFDKFFRAADDGAQAPNRLQGIGMGLAIARGIVEAHDGRIWIEDSAAGRGTRVAFTVPVGDEETPPDGEPGVINATSHQPTGTEV
jgi:K+-sensing histidine kinase KdpD